jgi:hypothetical protein
MQAKFYSENLRRKDYLENLVVDSKIVLKWIFKEIVREGVD